MGPEISCHYRKRSEIPKIWSKVLGDRTIHLRYTPAYFTCSGGGGRPTVEKHTAAKWKHDICVAALSEQAIGARFGHYGHFQVRGVRIWISSEDRDAAADAGVDEALWFTVSSGECCAAPKVH